MSVEFTGLNLQGSIDRKLDSISWISCRFIFLQNFQFSQSLFDVEGFMFYSKYKRKNPSYILEVFDVLCVESFVRFRDVYLYTHLELSRSRFMWRTWWLLQLLHKELKEDLKPLSGVSKSQVGVLVVVVDQEKK